MKITNLALSIGLLLAAGFSSCKKNDIPPTKSKMEYLTSKAWVYDEYFTGYNTSSTLLAYKRGKANNSMNMSLNRVKFNSDGTYQEITESGQQLSGTWKFLNNETSTEVTNIEGVFTATIMVLNDSKYEWYNSTTGRYGKLIPID